MKPLTPFKPQFSLLDFFCPRRCGQGWYVGTFVDFKVGPGFSLYKVSLPIHKTQLSGLIQV